MIRFYDIIKIGLGSLPKRMQLTSLPYFTPMSFIWRYAMKEIWKETFFSKNYLVSNFGKVKSKDRIVVCNRKKYSDKISFSRKGTQIKPEKTKNGYLVLRISINGIKKRYLLHRVVAIAFLPNPNNFPCINHKDGNKENNNIKNLEWCTYSYNNKHAFRVLGKKSYKQIKIKCVETGEIFESIAKAKEIYKGDIQACIAGRQKTSAGLHWRTNV